MQSNVTQIADNPTASRSRPVYTSEELLQGTHEVAIMHGDQEYRLRLTGNGKLILTK